MNTVPSPPRPAALLLAAFVLAAGCAPRTLREVPSGKESIYAFLSQGEARPALGLLSDVWDLGPRTQPVRLRPLDWTADPFQDSYWRFLFCSLRPTSNLLWAYYASGEERYRDKLLEILRSYAAYDAARPPAYDRNRFDNKHAAAFRALVLVNTVVKLRRSGDLPPDLDAALLDSLRRLGAFLALDENFDPDHNHGYAEAAGLLVLSENLPELAGAAGWRDLALGRLDLLMRNTVPDDGVQVENSPFYHFYSLGLAWEILRWGERWGVALPPDFAARTRSMLRYATLIAQPDGHVPLMGASVDLDVRSYRADLFDEIEAEAPGLAYVRSAGARGAAPAERAALFPSAGQAILRSGFGLAQGFADETHVVLDAGPYRTEHSHLDALSVVYYSAGRTLLPDSGLYTYDRGADHDYFNSTRAHNTVVVDELDQAAGAARPGLLQAGDGWAYQSGAHDLYAGVRHRRAVLLLRRDLALVIDQLDGSATHGYAQTWHLPAGAELQEDGLDAAALLDGAPALAIRQALPQGVTLSAQKGATAPMQGWLSARYGQKEAGYALAYRARAAAARFVTLLASGPYAAQPPRVEAAAEGAALRVTVCGAGVAAEAAITNLAQAGEAASVGSASCTP